MNGKLIKPVIANKHIRIIAGKLWKSILTLIASTYFICFLLSISEKSSSAFLNSLKVYYNWLISLMQFNIGDSVRFNKSIYLTIFSDFSTTLPVVLTALFLSIYISFQLGYKLALCRITFIKKIIELVLNLISPIPIFIVSLLLLPLTTKFGLTNMFLKFVIGALILAIFDGHMKEMVSLFYKEISAILNENYIKAARMRNAKLIKHVYPNCSFLILSLCLSKFIYFLGGAVIIEYIYLHEGIGLTLLNMFTQESNINNNDIKMILTIILAFFIIILTADIVITLLKEHFNPYSEYE